MSPYRAGWIHFALSDASYHAASSCLHSRCTTGAGQRPPIPSSLQQGRSALMWLSVRDKSPAGIGDEGRGLMGDCNAETAADLASPFIFHAPHCRRDVQKKTAFKGPKINFGDARGWSKNANTVHRTKASLFWMNCGCNITTPVPLSLDRLFSSSSAPSVHVK